MVMLRVGKCGLFLKPAVLRLSCQVGGNCHSFDLVGKQDCSHFRSHHTHELPEQLLKHPSSSAGAFHFSQAVLPLLLKANENSPKHPPTLVFTGATASIKGSANFAGFAAGKFALRAMSQSLAREYGPKGVHVSHAIIDGVIDIPRTKDWNLGKDAKISSEAVSDSCVTAHADSLSTPLINGGATDRRCVLAFALSTKNRIHVGNRYEARCGEVVKNRLPEKAACVDNSQKRPKLTHSCSTSHSRLEQKLHCIACEVEVFPWLSLLIPLNPHEL